MSPAPKREPRLRPVPESVQLAFARECVELAPRLRRKPGVRWPAKARDLSPP